MRAEDRGPSSAPLQRSWLLGMVLDDRRLERAVASDADMITLDLEDAVVPDRKAEGRARVLELIEAGRSALGGREVWVRVNSLFTPWGVADLHAIAGCPIDGLVYPRARGAQEVAEVSRVLRDHGSRARLKIIVETPQAVLELVNIARVAGVTDLLHGPGDLSVEAGIALDERAAFGYTATQTVLAARAHGLGVSEGVHLEQWRDPAAVRAYVEHAKRQGFESLNSFYLPHMEIINDVLTPTAAELEHSAAVVDAYEAGLADGRPAVVLDGKAIMVHQYRKALKVLASSGATR